MIVGALVLAISGAAVGLAGAQPLLAEPVEAPATPIEKWEVVGDGPIHIVLIPGLACDGSVFQDFMRSRTGRYTFHALTLPGMAGTTAPAGVNQVNFTGTPWMDNAVRAVGHYIETNGLRRPLVMGHAMGGTIAFRFAAKHPSLTSGVVSLDGFPAVPLNRSFATAADRQAFIMGGVAGRLHSQTADEWFRSTDMMANMFTLDDQRNQELAGMFRQTAHPVARRYMIEFYALDESVAIAESGVPVLAVGSIDVQAAAIADNRGGTEAARQRWRDAIGRIPNGTLVLAEDCKHFLFDECPQLIDEALEAFVRKHRIGPGDDAPRDDARGGGAEGSGGEPGRIDRPAP